MYLSENKKNMFVFFLLFTLWEIFPQNFSRGLILESEDYNRVSKAPQLTRESYFNISSNYSLKKYSPKVRDQGQYSTCGAWATTYSARTISYIIANEIPFFLIDSVCFSPSFVYNQLKTSPECDNGITLIEALDVLKHRGALRLSEFEYSCDRAVSEKDLNKAKDYSILEFREIFYKNDENKIIKTKKSIFEKKPVVIAMACPISFETTKELWIPDIEDYGRKHNGHALVVVGYDDTKFGGSFEVMNSWGENWGKDGFCWIRYSDFNHFVYYGYDIIDKKNENDGKRISGNVYIKFPNGKFMKFTEENNFFSSIETYSPNTEFEIFINNKSYIYLYCFSLDNEGNLNIVFPQDSCISNLIFYNNSSIPIPDEYHYLRLDEKGTEDYLIMIISKQKISLDDFFKKLRNKNKFSSTILRDLIKHNDQKVHLENNEKIIFRSISEDNGFIPIILKIKKSIIK